MKSGHLLFLATAMLCASCGNQGKYLAPAGVVTQDYFPVDPDGQIGISDSQLRWYSRYLQAINEPPLPPLAADASREIYRFTLLQSKGAGPQSVRLSRMEQGYTIHHARLAGMDMAGAEPTTGSASLTAAQVRPFLRLFRDIGFFTKPSTSDYLGLDGDRWILEVVRDGRYHVVDRWSPESNTEEHNLDAFVKACKWLLAEAPSDLEQGSAVTDAANRTGPSHD